MNTNVKLSIIIPVYNAEKTIYCTLESIKKSGSEYNLDQVEIICVNDGSSDLSSDIIKSNFPTVVLLEKENGGTASARNVGIIHSSGEYILFIDADDLVSEGYIDSILRALVSRDDIYYFDVKSNIKNISFVKTDDLRVLSLTGSVCNKVYSKTKMIPFKEQFYMEDEIFLIDLITTHTNMSISKIDDVFYLINREVDTNKMSNVTNAHYYEMFNEILSISKSADYNIKALVLEKFSTVIFNGKYTFHLKFKVLLKVYSKYFYLLPYVVLRGARRYYFKNGGL